MDNQRQKKLFIIRSCNIFYREFSIESKMILLSGPLAMIQGRNWRFSITLTGDVTVIVPTAHFFLDFFESRILEMGITFKINSMQVHF